MQKDRADKEFEHILEQMRVIRRKKGHDYADENDTFKNYRIGELLDIRVWENILMRIGEKWTRLANFSKKGTILVKEDKIESDMLDMAVQSVLMLMAYTEYKETQPEGIKFNIIDEITGQGIDTNLIKDGNEFKEYCGILKDNDGNTVEVIPGSLTDEPELLDMPPKMEKVYVCSPFSTGDKKQNIEDVQDLCRYITLNYDAIPIAPHLLFPQFLDDNRHSERSLGIELGIDLMWDCNKLYIFNYTPESKGMAEEIKRWIDVKGKENVYFIFKCTDEGYYMTHINLTQYACTFTKDKISFEGV